MTRPLEVLVEEIVARHDDLDALAAAAEALRTAPTDLVSLLRSLRTSMVKAPTDLDGDELSPPEQLRYFEALAYANPTAGWIGFVHAGATGMAGARLPDEGVARIFGGAEPPLCAGVAAPTGTCERVSGGLRLDGRWAFASGVRHADYVLLAAMQRGDDPTARTMLVPVVDVELHDDWHVMAQKGTGSVDVEVHGVEVPDEMVLLDGPTTPRGGPLYSKLSLITYVAGENGGFTIGVAQRFLDELAAYARTKKRGRDGALSERGAFRYEFGRAGLQVSGARALLDRVLTNAWDHCVAGNALSPSQDADVAGALAFATESAVDAVTRLFRFAGAGALHEANILQRCFRDVLGSAQHYLASNAAYERCASLRLAAPP
jgi:alkylation response protein AidB-like acyl-CoA dehydrogenase